MIMSTIVRANASLYRLSANACIKKTYLKQNNIRGPVYA